METFEQLREYLQSRQIYRTMSEQARAQRNVSGVSEEEEKYNARGGSRGRGNKESMHASLDCWHPTSFGPPQLTSRLLIDCFARRGAAVHLTGQPSIRPRWGGLRPRTCPGGCCGEAAGIAQPHRRPSDCGGDETLRHGRVGGARQLCGGFGDCPAPKSARRPRHDGRQSCHARGRR